MGILETQISSQEGAPLLDFIQVSVLSKVKSIQSSAQRLFPFVLSGKKKENVLAVYIHFK